MSRSMSHKKLLTPEELLSQAIEEQGNAPTEGELHLLTSGYKALKEKEQKQLNQREVMSIYSMFAYVAYDQNVDQETVQEVLLARYGAKTIEDIQAHRYMDAIEFLVDLKMDKVVN